MNCVSCGSTESAPSPAIPRMCSRCYWRLPAATRAAYQHGTIGIKQIARASRDSQRSVRVFGGGSRRGVIVLLVALLLVTRCGVREQRVDTPPSPSPVRVDTTGITLTGTVTGSLESAQPNVHSASSEDAAAQWEVAAKKWQTVSEEWQHNSEEWQRIAERNERTATSAIASANKCLKLCGQAKGKTEPLRRAEVRTVTFATPALPTPILDMRVRECIGYPLTTSFARVRYNLLVQPNLYDVTIRNWSDPKWLATFRVEGGTFPVNLWRKRLGEPDQFIKQVRVQAGPGLPTGNPQEALSATDFRGGDVLCVETPRTGGAAFVAYDQQTGLVVQPQLSMIQNSSNDSTPVPGVWTTIGGEVAR